MLFGVHKDLEKIVLPFEDWSHDDLSDLEVLIVLLEDRRFFEHRGIDIRSVAREVLKMITFRRHGGASTIDMQFVRTQTGYKELTLRRKMYEMTLAYLLQFRMNKLGILRRYLQLAYMGHGLRGIDEAAQEVFGKAVWELDRTESAFIAAMLVYPKPSRESPNWRTKVERRAGYGLRLFSRHGSRYKQRFE